MMMLISYHICGGLDILIVLSMMRRIFPPRGDPARSRLIALGNLLGFLLCNGAAITAGALELIDLDRQGTLFFLFLFLFSWPCSLGTLKGSFQQITVTWLFYICTLLQIFTIRSTVRTLLLSESTLAGLVLSNVIFYLVLAAFAALFCRITRPITLRISGLYWLVAVMTPLLGILLLRMLGAYFIHEQWYGVTIILLHIVLMLFAYYLFIKLAVEQERQMELELQNQSLAFQLRQVDRMKEDLERTRQARHEMRNQYFLLESLQRQGKQEELAQALHEITHTQLASDQLASTGNHLVDMILSEKMAEAEQKGIPFLLDVKLPESLAVDQRLLCSLLCNLLDNALEASERTQRPDISFSMRLSKGYLSIQCKNRIDGSVLQSNPTLHTSKSDSFSHGIGLRLIRQTVDRCDGDLRIQEDGGYFSVRILLPDRAEG